MIINYDKYLNFNLNLNYINIKLINYYYWEKKENTSQIRIDSGIDKEPVNNYYSLWFFTKDFYGNKIK